MRWDPPHVACTVKFRLHALVLVDHFFIFIFRKSTFMAFLNIERDLAIWIYLCSTGENDFVVKV